MNALEDVILRFRSQNISSQVNIVKSDQKDDCIIPD